MRRDEDGAALHELPARREGLRGCFEVEDAVSFYVCPVGYKWEQIF